MVSFFGNMVIGGYWISSGFGGSIIDFLEEWKVKCEKMCVK